MWRFISPTASQRKLRLAICAGHPVGLVNNLGLCVEHVEPEWEYRLVQIAEQFADGMRTTDELIQARAKWVSMITALESGNKFAEDDDRFWIFERISARLHRLLFAMLESLPNSTRFEELGVFWQPDDRDSCKYFRDIFGNPFRSITIDPRWQVSTVIDLSRTIYDERRWDRIPILADALMDAGCDSEEIINHCRRAGEHVRGCWAVDKLLGKE